TRAVPALATGSDAPSRGRPAAPSPDRGAAAERRRHAARGGRRAGGRPRVLGVGARARRDGEPGAGELAARAAPGARAGVLPRAQPERDRADAARAAGHGQDAHSARDAEAPGFAGDAAVAGGRSVSMVHPTGGLAAFALDALEEAEAAAVEAHLETCAECQARLEEFREVAAALAQRLPPLSPPPELGQRILREAGGIAATPDGSVAPRRPRFVSAP